MKPYLSPALCCLLLVAAFRADAAKVNPEQLAQSKQCMSCHAIDAHAYAPSFKDIARKHSAATDTEMLVRKVKNGGRQHWGDVAMPPSGTLSTPLTDAEARILVRWVLSQR